MDYIFKNIDKVKSITLKKSEDCEGDIEVGFTAIPPDGEDFGVGEATLFLTFNIKNGDLDDKKIIDYIKATLMAGMRVSEEGVSHLLELS